MSKFSRRYRRFWRADPKSDVEEEIAFHLAMRAEEGRQAGLTEDEAERAAIERFGDVQAIRAEVSTLATRRHARERRSWRAEALKQDIRFALRTLRATPSFAIAVIVTLALGIAANTAVFGLAYGILLRPLPFKNAHEILRIWSRNDRANLPLFSVSADDYRDWRDYAHSFSTIAAFERQRDVTLLVDGRPAAASMTVVTTNVFSVLEAAPVIGRTLGPADARPDAAPVVVLGYRTWTKLFGGDSSVVGRSIQSDGRPYTVVGVMPPGWLLPNSDAGVFGALSLDGLPEQRGNRYLRVLGRLAPGATRAQAMTELKAISSRAYQADPQQFADWTVTTTMLTDNLIGPPVRRAIQLLIGVAIFVLLIACANAANLQLARAAARDREIAVRLAMGASRGRIVRQLLTESVVVALIAGVIGVALAAGGISLLRTVGVSMIPRLEGATISPPVMAFAALVTLGSGLLFGMAPVFRFANTAIGDVLARGARAARAAVTSRVRAALVIAEIAMSLVLLIGAGLLARSFARLAAVDLGFNDEPILTARLPVPEAMYPDDAVSARYHAAALERVAAIPGIESAALVSAAPFAGPNSGTSFIVVGDALQADGRNPLADYRRVSTGYFRTMGIRLLRGRDILPSDREDTAPVAVISSALAKMYFRDRDPLGRQIRIGDLLRGPVATIVGVVEDARYQSLEADSRPMMYFSWHRTPQRSMAIVARAQGGHDGAVELAPTLGRALATLDGRLPAPNINELHDLVGQAMSSRQFVLLLFGIFASTALVLSLVGLYGVLSYLVRLRSHELGVRAALGAPATALIRLVVVGALRLTFAGIALGLGGAYALTGLLKSLLFNVSPTDGSTFAILTASLAITAIAASLPPALRASRSDPMQALRE